MTWPDVILTGLALPIVSAGAYLAIVALLARRPPQPAQRFDVRFLVVVPAHDEEAGIADTVRSLLAMEYPRDAYRVVVIADNCRDATAARAEAAGAEVMARDEPDRRGKGPALAWAFARLLNDGFAEAVAVVDADSVVSPNLLAAFAARIGAGAPAVQACYGVRNPEASWRTRLMHLAFTLFHELRSEGRERLNLSCGLRGNGMAFARQTLIDVPHEVASIVEDLEYGIRLALAGWRVHYAAEARVFGEMASTEEPSRSQRRRWEEGRLQLAERYARPLVRRAFRDRDLRALEMAVDLAVPPFSSLVIACTLGQLVCLAGFWMGARPVVAATAWSIACLSMLAYGVTGYVRSGLGWSGLGALSRAPLYILWKLRLGLRSASETMPWVRTTRETRGPVEPK